MADILVLDQTTTFLCPQLHVQNFSFFEPGENRPDGGVYTEKR